VLAFSHRVHVQEQALDCVSCHESFAVAEEPGMPVLDGCLFCHAEMEPPEDPARRIETLFDDQSFRAAHVAALDDEVRFEHLRHVGAVGECATCHHGIETSERVGGALALSMDDCVRCHEREGQPDACAACHSEISTAWMPPTHLRNWRRAHGEASRLIDAEPSDRCSLCHEESTCAECHRSEPPQNHNANWRLRGHAIVAMIDRDNCAACHEPASCDRCHAEVLPRNHVASWGSPRDTHCLVCHFPLRDEGCVACHRDTPSHLTGPPKPPWHTPGMNCRQCHGAQIPLPHVDDGGDCNRCHP
jgi:hypothetical protein